MANSRVYWTGAVSTTFATNGNWSSGTAPVDTDYITFTAASNNCDGASTGITPSTIAFAKSWNKSAGSSGTKLAFVDVTTLYYEGNTPGKAYIEVAASFPDAFFTPPNGDTDALTLYVSGSSTLTNLWVLNASGGLTVVTGPTITNIFVLNSPGAVITIPSGVTITTINQDSATINSASGCTTWNCYGGSVKLTGAAAITTLNVVGGTFDDRSSGTIGAVNGYSGVYTVENNPQTKTITAANEHMRMEAFRLKNDANTVTVTTHKDYTGNTVEYGKTRA